jgi:Ca2+-transporting ATPase
VLRHFDTDDTRGLDAAAVARARARYGYNELAEAAAPPWWKRMAGQFNQLVIYILVAAAAISGVLGDWVDSAVILAIVALNGVLGFFQEERAGRALAALRKLSAPHCRVFRSGSVQLLPAREIVPGDVIELEAGDQVPADARLLRAVALRVQEAALTGESSPVGKDHRPVLDPKTPLADRRNMVHMATVVAAGQAVAVVVATGMDTELGHIAGMLRSAAPEPTPLQRRLEVLGRVLIYVCLGAVAVIFALELARGGRLAEVFLLSVSLAVAAVPEGLPAVVTIALAVGLQRMARRNALVRKLPSVETLGSVTVICSDKTGTLTRNEMTVRELHVAGRRVQVTGTGYAPRGEFRLDGQPIDAAHDPGVRRALQVGQWCNHADVQPSETGESWTAVGDPTEAALVVAARKAGISGPNRRQHTLFEIPFDSDRKAMSVVVAGDAAGHGSAAGAVMYTKGAPEVILGMCAREYENGHVRPMTPDRRERVAREAADMASRALRVLGLAYREHHARGEDELYAEEDLVFAGLVGMLDPPREEVKDAVDRCRSAGIRPVMITGDHPTTAAAIARELGIARDDGAVVTGHDLDALSDEALSTRVADVSVYARVTAAHKLRVVRALRRRGEVVAMTGDGVNDAPAVDEADIGIAMGVTGTDVTKAAADMVLTDDNFTSIVNAVEEGRGIFNNIQKFVHYLLASNASEVLFMFFAALVGWPLPLLAIQVLWINLVTDSLPALGLGTEPPEPDAMRRPPRPLKQRMITRRRGAAMLFHGALMAAATATAFYLVYGATDSHLGQARSAAFFTISLSQLFYAFACRSDRNTMPQVGPFTNPPLAMGIAGALALQLAVLAVPPLRRLFEVEVLSGAQWLLVVGLALVPVTLVEVLKWVPRRAGAAAEA